jgi:hypothetical protein
MSGLARKVYLSEADRPANAMRAVADGAPKVFGELARASHRPISNATDHRSAAVDGSAALPLRDRRAVAAAIDRDGDEVGRVGLGPRSASAAWILVAISGQTSTQHVGERERIGAPASAQSFAGGRFTADVGKMKSGHGAPTTPSFAGGEKRTAACRR